MNWSRENRKIKTGSILTSRIPPVCQQSEIMVYSVISFFKLFKKASMRSHPSVMSFKEQA